MQEHKLLRHQRLRPHKACRGSSQINTPSCADIATLWVAVGADRLLACLRAFDGVYEPNIIAETEKHLRGSNVYSRLIAIEVQGHVELITRRVLGRRSSLGRRAKLRSRGAAGDHARR